MKTLASLIGVCAICLGLSGCMARIMDFTLISTKNVDIPGEKGPRVQGEDMASIVILFPTGQPNIKTAVDRAIENGRGDLLADGVISQKFWYIPYVFGQTGFVVEGNIVNTAKAPKAAPAAVASARAPAAAGASDDLGPPTPASAGGSASAPPPVSSYGSAPAQEEPEAPHAPKPAPLTQAQADAELLP